MIVVIYIIYAKETNIKNRVHDYSGYQTWLGVIDIKQRKPYKKDISNELVPLAWHPTKLQFVHARIWKKKRSRTLFDWWKTV